MENNYLVIEHYLDDYLHGKISREQLEESLQLNGVTNIEGEIEQHKAAINAVQRFEVFKQVQKVHNIFINDLQKANENVVAEENKTAGTKVVKMGLLKKIIRIAAIFIIISGGSILYISTTVSSTKMYDELSLDYYVPVIRSNAANGSITDAFNKNNYDAVINIYAAMEKPNQRENFLAGYAYIKTGKFENALTAFRNINTINEKVTEQLYQDEADYYAGLCYLHLENYKASYNLFSKINAVEEHTYHNKISNWILLKLRYLDIIKNSSE